MVIKHSSANNMQDMQAIGKRFRRQGAEMIAKDGRAPVLTTSGK